jgi:hypothetical protein
MQIDSAIIIILISTIGTLLGGGYAVFAQLKKDKAAGNVELIRLQDEIERDLWIRMKEEFTTMQAQIDQQGALIMQLREQIRIIGLERDDWRERALAAERRRGTGRNL